MYSHFKYDVFVSYRQREPDMTWVRSLLLPRLRTAGLAVCVDYECFRLGNLLIHEMEQAIQESRYTLAVFSPAYLDSNFTDFENVLAEHLGLVESQRRLLVLMRQACTPRLGVSARLWLDMTNDEAFEVKFAELLKTLEDREDL